MGLAPYGKPAFMDQMRRMVRLKPDGAFELDLRYFLHHSEEVPYQWADGSPEVGDLFSPAMEELLGPRRRSVPLESRHHDIARSVQVMYEEAFFHLITNLQKRTGLTDIALAGGCAANSVANRQDRRQTQYKRVYVQSAAGDAGGAIGAGVYPMAKAGRRTVLCHGPRLLGDPNFPIMKSPPSSKKTAMKSVPAAVRSKISLTRRSFAAEPLKPSRTVRWSAGFRGAWSGVRALWATGRLCATRGAPT